jgi:hypothetical protein
LPLPPDCRLADWLLATRAWALGAKLYFDHTPHMAYRQYAANIAPVLPPFNETQVLQSTEKVLNHYRCLLDSDWELPPPYRHELLRARNCVEIFHQAITRSNDTLREYVQALNHLEPQYIWWWSVANQDLEKLWRS